MPETVDFTILRGCDYRVRMRMTTPPNASDNVDAWTLVFEVRQTRGGSTVISIPGALSNLPQANVLGVFDFVLPASNTSALSDRTYFYAVRRTNANYVDVFSRGLLGVESF